MTNYLLKGDPMHPSPQDMIAQTKTSEIGKPVPEGWRVLGNSKSWYLLGRVIFRCDIEEENQYKLKQQQVDWEAEYET